jgi:hypothetical protein
VLAARHRWSGEERAAIASAAAGARGEYVSAANPVPIYTLD